MSALRQLCATRYITPLREGGSMPAVVEADDDGTYVLKFRGAGQGRRALVAEVIAGGIARALGLPVPELVVLQVDPQLARNEPDSEIQELLQASAGLNLGMDFLPGALNFDPLVDVPDPALASAVVWFDALVTNVDRTARNTNLMMWHRQLWLIDHGAALYFHHGWDGGLQAAGRPFVQVREHVLLPRASRLQEVDAELAPQLDAQVLGEVVAAVPDEWLQGGDAFADAATQRQAYVDWLSARLQARQVWLAEAVRARG